jgi:MAC/Perforin domain
MKKIIFIFSTVLFLSCSENVEETNIDTQKRNRSLERAGDGIYDVLGAGYDVTGEYADATSARFQVLDIPALIAAQPNSFSEEFPFTQSYIETYGENAITYAGFLTGNALGSFTPTAPVFAGSLDFSDTNRFTFESNYVYGSYDLRIQQKRLRFNSTVAELNRYVTTDFLEDVAALTPAEFVENYGTHVLTDIYTGAKLDALFQSQTTNTNKINAAQSLVKAGVLNLYGVEVNNQSTIEDNDKNFDRKVSYKTRGGNPGAAIAGFVNVTIPGQPLPLATPPTNTTIPRIDWAAWQATSTPANSVLVNFGPSGLKLIYEFIADPVKKAEIKAYVDQYLFDRRVQLPPEPTFYVNEFLSGTSVSLPLGNYPNIDLKGFPNDQLSSVKVPPGYIVELYEHHNFGGRLLVLSAGDDYSSIANTLSNLNPQPDNFNWDNVTTSVIVTYSSALKAQFYVDQAFSGNSASLPLGDYPSLDLKGIPNDQLSSVIVPRGYEVVLYEHHNFGGRSIVLSGKNTNLAFFRWISPYNFDWNNVTTSVKVRLKT